METRLAVEARLELLAKVGVPAAEADDGRPLDREPGPRGAREIADGPPSSRDDDDRRVAWQAESAACFGAGERRAESGRDDRPHDPCTVATGIALDGAHAGLVHDEVEVDSAVRPEGVRVEVGDRRDRRVRRDNEVGVDAAYEPHERSGAKEGEPTASEGAGRRKAREEDVFEPIRPGQKAELNAVSVTGKKRNDPPESPLVSVLDDDFGLRLGREFLSDSARSGVVPVTLLGRKDEHAKTTVPPVHSHRRADSSTRAARRQIRTDPRNELLAPSQRALMPGRNR